MNKKNLGWLIACLLLVTAAVVPFTSNYFTSPNYTGTTASTARTYLGLGSIATNAEGRFLTVTNPAQVVGTFRVGTASTVNTTISSNGTVIGTGSVFDFYTGSRAFIGQPTNATEVPLHVVKRNDQATNMVELETVGGVVLAGANSNGVWFGDGSLLTGVTDSTALHQSSNLGDVQSVSASRANLGIDTNSYTLTNDTRALTIRNAESTVQFKNIKLGDTNLLTGTGTVSATINGHLWTNSGTGFAGMEVGNYLIITNSQWSVDEIISSSVIRTFEVSGNYTNAPWKYYTNVLSIYDQVPRFVGAIDEGAGIWILGTEIANAGRLWWGSGSSTISAYVVASLAGIGPAWTLYAEGGNPFSVYLAAPHDSLVVQPDGSINIGSGPSNKGGFTNIYGPGNPIPFYVMPKFTTGSPGVGKVWTGTDSVGSAAWSNAPSGSGLSSLTVPSYLSTNGSLTDPVISGNGNAGTFASLQVTNTASASALSVTNTASVSALNVTNTAAVSALNVTNTAAVSALNVTNAMAANKVTATNGIIDNGPTTNTLLTIVNVAGGRVLTNIVSVADGQTIVRDNATAGGWKATNWPASGSGTVTSVALDFSPGWLTVTGSPVTTSGTLTLSGNGNTATLDSLITTNDVQARGFIAPNSGGFVEINQSFLKSGSDSPEGVVTLTTGSLYLMDTTNGLPWAKTTSGSGNTGWQQLQSANTVTDIVNAITLPATNFLAATNGAGTNLLITNLTTAGVTNTLYTRQTVGTLSVASSTNAVIDFSLTDTEVATLSANLNIYQSTNRLSGFEGKHKIWLYPNGSDRIITLTNASWYITNNIGGTTRTFTLTNGYLGLLSVDCIGSSETNLTAILTVFHQ